MPGGITKAAVAAVIAAAAAVASTTSAQATPLPYPIWDQVSTGSHVGVYSQPYDTPANNLGYTPLSKGDYLKIDCWVAGGQVGNAGDVWYRTWQVEYANGSSWATVTDPWWTFAPYVDGASYFHNNTVPPC
ncbi:hypothetical protein [Streptomyces sp. CoH27]|uniref:hypothetical protein n=1 Tax=Streptomyces sp. CoH27 TaxID=2875763 RepID=UPI001CD2A6AC|nr:hypothetical protein [Streptomyces sp. CoH27]